MKKMTYIQPQVETMVLLEGPLMGDPIAIPGSGEGPSLAPARGIAPEVPGESL